MAEAIKVAVRVRPFNKREQDSPEALRRRPYRICRRGRRGDFPESWSGPAPCVATLGR